MDPLDSLPFTFVLRNQVSFLTGLGPLLNTTGNKGKTDDRVMAGHVICKVGCVSKTTWDPFLLLHCDKGVRYHHSSLWCCSPFQKLTVIESRHLTLTQSLPIVVTGKLSSVIVQVSQSRVLALPAVQVTASWTIWIQIILLPSPDKRLGRLQLAIEFQITLAIAVRISHASIHTHIDRKPASSKRQKRSMEINVTSHSTNPLSEIDLKRSRPTSHHNARSFLYSSLSVFCLWSQI